MELADLMHRRRFWVLIGDGVGSLARGLPAFLLVYGQRARVSLEKWRASE
jgi:hypothetical protein